MSLNSLIIRAAAGTVLVVGGVLFAAQSGLIGSSVAAQSGSVSADNAVLASASRPSGSMAPALPQIDLAANVHLPAAAEPVAPEALIRPASFDDQTPQDAAPVPVDGDMSELGLPCTIAVTATALPAAMVGLDVMAPCRGDAAVTIVHSGLQITARTDALGLLTLDIPAFETPAFFSVTFEDMVEENVLIGLSDLRDYDRVGLNWDGDMGLELHAMEFGATFGQPGHIWQEAPASPDVAIAGESGFLSVISTGESHVQVYTLPRATLRAGDGVHLSIDAPVTPNNCTRDVMARTLRAEAGGTVDVTELTFTVPGCDAVGDVLVLQNLLDDLRLASN